jgi:uncharacterized protein (TIGR02217 family)
MAFHDILLPESFSYGSAGGPGFGTIIDPTASGHEWRIARQSQAVHRLSLIAQLQTPEQAKALKSFALARRGALHSFKVRDVSDYTSAENGEDAPTDEDQFIGTGDGTEVAFQLVKRYEVDGPNEYARTITLPVVDSVVVALDGVAEAGYTVNGQGEVVFDTAPANGVEITAGFEFYVPVRFSQEFDRWARLQADAFEVWSLNSLDLVEVLDEVEQPERFQPGGLRDWGETSSAIFPAFNDGRGVLLTCVGDHDIVLPVPTHMGSGPRVLEIICRAGSTHNVQVLDDAGNAIGFAFGVGGARRQLALVRGLGSTVSWEMHR